MGITLRRLEPADAAIYHALRLDGLERHPSAFRASYREEAALAPDEIRGRLAEHAVFGAFALGELCGIAGFERAGPESKRHKGLLCGVYVRPGVRREGLGRALVGAVIEHAQGRVVQLHAAVVVSNLPARRLYEALGFKPYGLEPRGLKVGDRYFDQELMVLLLDRAEPSA
ncbi:MAG: GNAT family N-acetyltransferase [Geminicoccales bacterium]